MIRDYYIELPTNKSDITLDEIKKLNKDGTIKLYNTPFMQAITNDYSTSVYKVEVNIGIPMVTFDGSTDMNLSSLKYGNNETIKVNYEIASIDDISIQYKLTDDDICDIINELHDTHTQYLYSNGTNLVLLVHHRLTSDNILMDLYNTAKERNMGLFIFALQTRPNKSDAIVDFLLGDKESYNSLIASSIITRGNTLHDKIIDTIISDTDIHYTRFKTFLLRLRDINDTDSFYDYIYDLIIDKTSNTFKPSLVTGGRIIQLIDVYYRDTNTTVYKLITRLNSQHICTLRNIIDDIQNNNIENKTGLDPSSLKELAKLF